MLGQVREHRVAADANLWTVVNLWDLRRPRDHFAGRCSDTETNMEAQLQQQAARTSIQIEAAMLWFTIALSVHLPTSRYQFSSVDSGATTRNGVPTFIDLRWACGSAIRSTTLSGCVTADQEKRQGTAGIEHGNSRLGSWNCAADHHSYCLQFFAQAHLIAEDPAHPILPQRLQPGHSYTAESENLGMRRQRRGIGAAQQHLASGSLAFRPPRSRLQNDKILL
eukprot:SAG31_NODE_2044_length_6580_cov_2.757445_4_plen_223_part_00